MFLFTSRSGRIESAGMSLITSLNTPLLSWRVCLPVDGLLSLKKVAAPDLNCRISLTNLSFRQLSKFCCDSDAFVVLSLLKDWRIELVCDGGDILIAVSMSR